MRVFLLSAFTGLCALSLFTTPYRAQHKVVVRPQTPPPQVYLGGSTFIPSSVSLTGSSTFTVSVSTTATVPAGVTAVLSLSENNNFNGIHYTISPAQIADVVLTGGGRSDNGQVTFTRFAKHEEWKHLISGNFGTLRECSIRNQCNCH
jgi:protein involved in polysaccharide export with SLBB domain